MASIVCVPDVPLSTKYPFVELLFTSEPLVFVRFPLRLMFCPPLKSNSPPVKTKFPSIDKFPAAVLVPD